MRNFGSGTITVIEGDHGSVYFHPESRPARRAIQCLIDLQARAGGDSLIGRSLYPILIKAGFQDVRVSPRMVYVDASRSKAEPTHDCASDEAGSRLRLWP